MPLLLAGAALSLAGTGMGIAGNMKSKAAVSAARAASMAKQKMLQGQANTIFQNSADQAGPDTTNADINKGNAARTSIVAALRQATQPASGGVPASDSTGYQVSDPTARMTATSGKANNAWSNLNNAAATNLASYGDWQTQAGIRNARATQGLGIISNKARGEANLLPLEMEVASHKGDSLGSWGQIVSALGSLGMMGGAMGLGAGAATGAASGAQLDALASGYGPVTAASASTLAPATSGMWSATRLAAQPLWSLY